MSLLIGIIVFIVLLFGFVVFFGAPYVPSKPREVGRAFDNLYRLGPDDLLLDLGSGDGLVLRAAAKRGARAVGFELNPVLVGLARLMSHGNPRVRSYVANLFTRPFPEATTVVYVFGDQRDIAKILRRIETETTRLGRPLAVMSYGFELPGHHATGSSGAHFLYEISPLQTGEYTL